MKTAPYKMYKRKTSDILYITNAFRRVIYIKNDETGFWKAPKLTLSVHTSKVDFIKDMSAEDLILELL